MDRRIRFIALFLVVCFGLLIAQLNNIQVRQASALNAKGPPYAASKSTLSVFNQPRGEIVTADGVVIARSVPTNDQYDELREYPQGSLYTDVTGYYDTTAFAAPEGIENFYDSYLQPHEATAHNLRQMLTEQSGTDTVVTTINSTVQLAAERALAGYRAGAVVAINPQTGAILAMYGKPTFDPNALATHDVKAAAAAFTQLQNSADPSASALINYATAQVFNPGSTFKVITTSAMYDHMPTLLTQSWPTVQSISLPQSNIRLQNFGGEVCGGTLAEVLAKSCDTSYATIGLRLGAPNLAAEATAFGFNQQPPIDLPAGEVAPACFPPVDLATPSQACGSSVQSIGSRDEPFLMYSAIGQKDVKESALQDALIASAIADGGKMMTPHLMAKIVSNTGNVVQSYPASPWKQATSEATAHSVLELMRGVVTGGTATPVQFPPNDHVAAKTGTAETGLSNCSTNWLIATAPADPTDTPTVAVAAVIPYQPGTTCDGTGAQFAGPVVKSVLAAALAIHQ